MNLSKTICPLLTIAALTLIPHPALAQAPYGTPQFRRPAVSPYLHLLEQTDSGVSTYFTQVRPLLRQGLVNTQQLANVQQLQHQAAIATAAGQPGAVGIRQTGHVATYRSYSHYFPAITARLNSARQSNRR